MKDYVTLDLGDIKLLSGKILKSAIITYNTYGTLNKNSNNVVILPTFYTGTHKRNEGFFGSGRAIDPNKYFIVSINMFGNGLSSSPSNSSSPQDGPRFPDITLWDNINCQHKLLTEKLIVKKIASNWMVNGRVPGLSMGSSVFKYGKIYSSILRFSKNINT